MKVVVNRCYGGFSLPDAFCKKYNCSTYDDIDRNDQRLVQFVEENPDQTCFNYAHLKIVEIPDEATDWQINEYDGAERIIAVINGKIEWL